MSIAYKEVATRLGISIGTRYMGMAVLWKGELIDWRIRNFYEAWSDKKRDRMLGKIQQTIARYKVTAIVIKTPVSAQWSDRLRELIQSIYALCDASGIYVEACTIQTLEKRYIRDGRANKGMFIDAVIQKYPEMKTEYAKYKRKGKPNEYYEKVFEAIVCAEIGLETGQ